MHKKLLLTLTVVVLSNIGLACDVCNLFTNIFPNENYSKIGFVYRSRFMYGRMIEQQQGFQVKHTSDSEVDNYYDKTIKDIFNVYELRAQFVFKERWKVMALIPLVNNYRSVNEYTIVDIYKIGDPMVLGQYLIYGTPSGDFKTTHRITGGAGIKIPIGSHKVEYQGNLVDDDLQPGTASWDFVTTLDYRFKFKSFGFQLNQSYRMNTFGYKDYKYGNSYNGNLSLFGIFKVTDNWVIMPQTGIYIEQASKDKSETGVFDNSGGHSLYHNSGIMIQWKKIQLAAQYQYRFYQNLNGIQIPTKNRLIVSLYYQFNLTNKNKKK